MSITFYRLFFICCLIYSVSAIDTTSGQCPPNEIKVPCIDRCQRCEYVNGGCVQIGLCEPGCNCVPGFYRNKQNVCVPRFFCEAVEPSSRQCPPNEIPVPCIDRCQRCEYIKGGCAQIQICEPGCNCLPGFFRNKQNVCVPGPFCNVVNPNSRQCPPNEIPVPCIDRCQRCEYVNGGCVQIALCEPGCNCLPGFFRNKQNVCVPGPFCDVVCGPNSKPSDCVFCEPTCRNPKPEACAQSCTKGCECDPGFIKDNNGNCIPKNQCPVTCGPNEVYSDCVNPCNDCTTRGNCQFLVCNKGCDCRKGYRRYLGRCIPESQCPPREVTCGPNSKYSECGSACPRTCNDREPKACPAVCVRGCFCNRGFILDRRGNCIPERKCHRNGK